MLNRWTSFALILAVVVTGIVVLFNHANNNFCRDYAQAWADQSRQLGLGDPSIVEVEAKREMC